MPKRTVTDDADAPKKKITLDGMVVMHHGDPRIRHGVADGTTRHELLDAPEEKQMPPMQTTPHASDAAGWCSDPSLRLSPAMLADLESIEALPALPAHLVAHGHVRPGLTRRGGPRPDGFHGGVVQLCRFPDLPGMSDRWVFQVNPEEAGRVYFVEDAQRYGAKYGHAKYGKKLELMAEDIFRTRQARADVAEGIDERGQPEFVEQQQQQQERTILLLLGRHQPVCRSGCLPAMAKAGIVVQRRAE